MRPVRGFRPRFFIPLGPEHAPEPRPGDIHSLNPADERHARVVLRAREGESCEVVLLPGQAESRLFSAHLAHREGEVVVVLEEELARPPVRLRLLLLQGLPAMASVDQIIEKGTEVGIDRFVLVTAAGSPKVPLARIEGRLARWRRIAEEAAKQSKQLALPGLEVAGSLESALRDLREEGWLPLAFDPQAGPSLADIAARLRPAPAGESPPGGALPLQQPTAVGHAVPAAAPLRLALVIGPEPGWTEGERESFISLGVTTCRLGRRILRAETAGPVAAGALRALLDDW
jgi:16S rRNA (uracil1498-N3)-methyltransferase